jgi:hypothetical protein
VPITFEEYLSYITQVFEIWILEYPVQAVSDLTRNNIYSSSLKAELALKGALGGWVATYEETEALSPLKAESALRS